MGFHVILFFGGEGGCRFLHCSLPGGPRLPKPETLKA